MIGGPASWRTGQWACATARRSAGWIRFYLAKQPPSLTSTLLPALRRLSQHRASWDERVAFFQWVMRGTISYVPLVGLTIWILHSKTWSFLAWASDARWSVWVSSPLSAMVACRSPVLLKVFWPQPVQILLSSCLAQLQPPFLRATLYARRCFLHQRRLTVWVPGHQFLLTTNQPTNQPTNQFPAGEHLTTMAMENP